MAGTMATPRSDDRTSGCTASYIIVESRVAFVDEKKSRR